MKDLYKILGVAEDADDDTIKKAYRKLAKENHPDATGGDKRKTERFKEINEAYGGPGRQAEAAASTTGSSTRRWASDGMPQGFDPDTFAQVFGGGGSARPRAAAGSTSRRDFDGDSAICSPACSAGGGGGSPFGRAAAARRRPRRAART